MLLRKLLFILFLLVTISCTNGTYRDSPNVGIEEEYLNTHIRLVAPFAINSFKINDAIAISLEGISQETIFFSEGDGVKIFLEGREGWVEVENLESFTPDFPRYLYPYKGNPTESILIGVLPVLPDPTQPANLRIFIIGNIVEDLQVTDQKVGAFIDVTLTPP